MLGAVLAIVALHLVPRPLQAQSLTCSEGVPVPRVAPRTLDAGALDELNERWGALGVGTLARGDRSPLRILRDRRLGPQAYRLRVAPDGVTIAAGDDDGAFYAAMTLAQLPRRAAGRWRLPCLQIADQPQLRWRILSDDVSRGPLPTMRYFKERIRTIAAFKMNGYSPYMEHVFASPTDPLPAPLDGITPAQLHELDLYARRFHVHLILEQQTFAHMHNTLRVEQYAPAAEFPHGFLLSPNVALSMQYLERLIAQERAAVPDSPFFHIGSDETSTLGQGQTEHYVADHGGRGAVYAAHVTALAKLVAPARVMVWDDAIEADPSIMKLLPRNAVIINWHYGAEKTFAPFIATIASGGFDQMVAPGANNWNHIYPDITTAIRNERLFIDQGKAAHVLGLFQTVWHDDGETLYESTWYPVLYAASSAWERDDLDPERFANDFPSAFFGSDDLRYSTDITHLADAQTRLGEYAGYDGTDQLSWADPFDPLVAATMAKPDLRAVRLDAEAVQTHLLGAVPPLHAAAARAIYLAARRYDALGRRYQIAQEVRSYYDDAREHAGQTQSPSVRDLFWCKYWFWEQRDIDEALAPLYAQAWQYESRDGHLASNLERYHLDAQRAIERADAMDRVLYEHYVPSKTLPPFDEVLPR